MLERHANQAPTPQANDRAMTGCRLRGRLVDAPTLGLEWVEAMWRGLEQHVEPNVFLTYDWMLTWWECFGDGHEPYIVLAEDDAGAVVGLAPLMRSHHRNALGMRWTTLRFIGHSVSDRLGFVCADAHKRQVAVAVVECLRRHREDWDVLQLGNLPDGSPEGAVVAEVFSTTHAVLLEPASRCPFLPIAGTWDDFLRDRSSNFRADLRRTRRRLEQELGGRFVTCSEPDGVRDALHFLFRHNVERFAARGTSAFSDPTTRSFHLAVASRLLANGRLVCQQLEVEGALVAVVYSLRHGDAVWYYNTAFDPRWSAWGPGKVALGYAVQAAFESGATEFDFLLGDHAYKRRWTSGVRQHRLLTVVKYRPLVILVAALPRWWISLKRRVKTTTSRPPCRIGLPALSHERRKGRTESRRRLLEACNNPESAECHHGSSMRSEPLNADSFGSETDGPVQAAAPSWRRPDVGTDRPSRGIPGPSTATGALRRVTEHRPRVPLREQLKAMRWVRSSYRFLRLWLGLSRYQQFAIAIFTGSDPWAVGAPSGLALPVLTHRDVTDVPAAFVADPFLMRRDDRWFMFFEVMRADTWRGEIAVATSDDGIAWTYERVVLAEPVHLSYPHVFEWDGEVYMIPETFERNAVCLYRAVNFPYEWSLEAELISGATFVDASVFRHEDRWWMLVESSARDPDGIRAPRHDTLRLLWASSVTGPWIEHPMSPIVEGDQRVARPAGRVLVMADGRIVRFAQDCSTAYGRQVYALEITELSPVAYRERLISERPILGPGPAAWHRGGMHHIDALYTEQGWLACVDGWSLKPVPRMPLVSQRLLRTFSPSVAAQSSTQ